MPGSTSFKTFLPSRFARVRAKHESFQDRVVVEVGCVDSLEDGCKRPGAGRDGRGLFQSLASKAV